MLHSIQTLYVIHHSHTDIGYTDLQERVIHTQVNYIRTVLSMMQKPEYADFRWNCETLFCVEEFFKTATEAEKQLFFQLAGENQIGLSANYLNFNDLVDSEINAGRLKEWAAYFQENGVSLHTAMIADINGISMGQRDALLGCGVKFLYTNVHSHHGMYPLFQNQNAFWWENAQGERLLVWNGEHYNLGNVLGIKPNRTSNFMMQNHLGKSALPADPVEALHTNLDNYLTLCEENEYAYDFIVTSVSGVFSDNAPPEAEILKTIAGYNARYGKEGVRIQMVSLQELYSAIAEKLGNIPVYHGDFNDWWANGVGSTPYAVKHYRDAQHRYHLCRRLDSDLEKNYPELVRCVQDNMLLYAEHTWGHSSTIICPYDTMVLNLDMRKNSYASKAHEAASMMLAKIAEEKGDILRYYDTSGVIEAYSVNEITCPQLVEFYIESPVLDAVDVKDEDGNVFFCQISPHPRGRKISFIDSIAPYTKKRYTYREVPAKAEPFNSRQTYMGAERVRDLVNDYDTVSYLLPYSYENEWFKLSYTVDQGITGFVDKRTGNSLLREGTVPFFTPMYECTPVDIPYPEGACKEEQERRLLGRNIRGKHAKLHIGTLKEVVCCESGDVFTILKLRYDLPGSIHSCVFIKFYNDIPRIDFRMELGKTISMDIESVFLPLTLELEDASLYLRKGTEGFRPGIDQLPGTCMEYSMSDDGVVYAGPQGSAMIAARDVPLVYREEMRHHPIRLCDNREENNQSPVYSWIMNNTWETNFKMDLSGFGEYCYSLWLTDTTEGEEALDELRERCFDPYVLIVE